MTIKMNKHLLKINPNNICGVDINKNNNQLRFGTYSRQIMCMEFPVNITQEGIDTILKTIAQALENDWNIVDLDAVLKE